MRTVLIEREKTLSEEINRSRDKFNSTEDERELKRSDREKTKYSR